MEDPEYFTNIVVAAVLLAPSKDLIDTDEFWKLSVEVEGIYNQMYPEEVYRHSETEEAYRHSETEERRDKMKFHHSREGHLKTINYLRN